MQIFFAELDTNLKETGGESGGHGCWMYEAKGEVVGGESDAKVSVEKKSNNDIDDGDGDDNLNLESQLDLALGPQGDKLARVTD